MIKATFCVCRPCDPTALSSRFCFSRICSCCANYARKYNVLDAGEGQGDELYGVEPASFYVKNLFLNTTVAFPLAIALPFLALVIYPLSDKVVLLS